MVATLGALDGQVGELDKEIARRSREDVTARRLMTIPGVGPITAVALTALSPPLEGDARGRDFAAWLGLTPRQRSTGGKQKLGSITKMGERTLRRFVDHWQHRRGPPGAPTWREQKSMAHADDQAEAADVGGGRVGQQDGADHLGRDDPKRRLPSSSYGSLDAATVRLPEAQSSEGRYGATVDGRGWKTRICHCAACTLS